MVTRRKDEPSANGAGKIKFRYTDSERTLDFSMENVVSDSVTEGLRSIANALAGHRIAVKPGRALPPKSSSPAEHEEAIIETAELEEVGETADQPAEEEATTGNGSERPRRRPAPRAPKFLSDLNLTTASVPLADFVKEKNPEGDMDKYAVIAAWFKDHFNTDEINVDHIFTAYRALGWQAQMPPDPSQTFRNLKNNKNWFDSGSKRGDYKINWNGADAVNKMGAAGA